MDNEPEDTSTPIPAVNIANIIINGIIFFCGASVGIVTDTVIRQQPQLEQFSHEARQSQLDLQTATSEYKQRDELANKKYLTVVYELAQKRNEIDELKQEVKQASIKTGMPTTRVLLEQNVDVLQMALSSNEALSSCVASLQKSNRFMEMANSTMTRCNQAREDDFARSGEDYTLINDVNNSTALLDVIRQHALAVGLENLTLADDGLVYEGEPDGNGALYFRDCSDSEHGCQEMAIETTVYSTELFLDKPVNLDEIEF